jgi:hypothetical protein
VAVMKSHENVNNWKDCYGDLARLKMNPFVLNMWNLTQYLGTVQSSICALYVTTGPTNPATGSATSVFVATATLTAVLKISLWKLIWCGTCQHAGY